MSRDTLNVTDDLIAYIRRVGLHEDADLAALREETAHHRHAGMQIGPEQGAFMGLLIRILGARRTLEIGVFTGYSAMVVAKAMGPEGKVLALDVSEEFTGVARRHWAKAGIADRIELRLRPAAESLQELVKAGATETFDFAFIDADKPNYDTYYEYALKLVRPGGLIAIDNVLWSGQVIDLSDKTPDTVAIRALNEKVHGDERVDAVLIPIGDGLTLARKR
jgi:caffeoyl-CoA O-methyltransferase